MRPCVSVFCLLPFVSALLFYTLGFTSSNIYLSESGGDIVWLGHLLFTGTSVEFPGLLSTFWPFYSRTKVCVCVSVSVCPCVFLCLGLGKWMFEGDVKCLCVWTWWLHEGQRRGMRAHGHFSLCVCVCGGVWSGSDGAGWTVDRLSATQGSTLVWRARLFLSVQLKHAILLEWISELIPQHLD